MSIDLPYGVCMQLWNAENRVPFFLSGEEVDSDIHWEGLDRFQCIS